MTNQCRPVEVDGEIIPVLGEQPMTAEDREHMATIVRAAKAHMLQRRINEAVVIEFGVDYDETNREHEVFVAGWRAAQDFYTAETPRKKR